MPAKAGIHDCFAMKTIDPLFLSQRNRKKSWMPAFAGMTGWDA
jgi:hypothetical protein